MPREVGAYDAKIRLPQLLREVEAGEVITITVRGRAVAELARPRRAPVAAEASVQAMLDFPPIQGLEAGVIRDWIAEGRT